MVMNAIESPPGRAKWPARFIRRRVAACIGLTIAAVMGGRGETVMPVLAQQPAPAAGELESVQIRPNVYMVAGAGANVAVHVGPIGLVIVDTGSLQSADRLLAAIRKLSGLPIRYIFNTSADPDHVGGNATLSKAGVTILGGSRGNASFTDEVSKAFDLNYGLASVFAHEEVLARMSRSAAFDEALWPTKVYTRAYSMALNGEGIQILHNPAAHSDGDSTVLFRRADVIVSGDIVDIERFPVIDIAAGGSIQGEIDALNRLLELIVPPFPLTWQAAGSMVIPGHGRPLDYSDVEEYRDMVVIVRDIIDDMIGRGMTLAQIKAADPTKAFRRRYGADAGSWTTDMFVEAVFKGSNAHTRGRTTPASR
jgi:glyoxylase-like metal-dependent hydrolase (beta-lactamase superfamily II)